MKVLTKKASAPLIVKKSPDAQVLKEQDAKFRSTFVEAMRSSSPPRNEPVILPEALVVPGLAPPAGPKPLPLVQPAEKPVQKPVAKKAAAKGGAKVAAKSGKKSSAKSGSKSGSKTGAKVGNLILKRTEPLNLESVATVEVKAEEMKAQTERIPDHQSLSIISENTESLGVACKVPPVIKLLQTVSFKRLVKPMPDLYYCESVQTVFCSALKPSRDLKLAQMNIKNFTAITKPPVGLFYSEQFAYRVMSKPAPKISYTEREIRTFSVMSRPQRTLFEMRTLDFAIIDKPQIPLYLHIPYASFPMAPTVEVIQDFDLSKKSIKNIQTVTSTFQVVSKTQVDILFDEDCFTSKFPVIVPAIKIMKNLQIEEEDWKIRRGPPVIEILETKYFELTSKPETEFFFHQKEFVEMCLQTEEILDVEEAAEPEETEGPDVLTFDEFIAKVEITPKNLNAVQFQFVDQAISKINEMESIKKEVKDRENTKFKRNKAAVKIQAWIRGLLARRREIPRIIEQYTDRLRKRRLAELAIRIKKSWAPYVIFNALQSWYKMKQREKQRIYRLFLNFSAISIQKNWRGYIIRKYYRYLLVRRANSKLKLRRLLRNWKSRKIMNTLRLKHLVKGLKDTKTCLTDMKQERGKLYQQLQSQLASYSQKIRTDFSALYLSGKWVNLPTNRESVSAAESPFRVSIREEPFEERLPVSQEEVPIRPTKFLNREDIPIRPLAMNYDELLKDYPEQPIATPPARPLRKRQPVKVERKEKPVEPVFVFNEDLEEQRQDDVKLPSKPKEFLKRKSRSVKPQKVDWKVSRRIDCWLPKEKMKIKEPKFEIQSIIPQGDFMSLGEIEKEFQNDLSSWISLEFFFDRSERELTKVPQIEVESICLKQYSESSYTLHIEHLENHYAYLCSEDVLSG